MPNHSSTSSNGRGPLSALINVPNRPVASSNVPNRPVASSNNQNHSNTSKNVQAPIFVSRNITCSLLYPRNLQNRSVSSRNLRNHSTSPRVMQHHSTFLVSSPGPYNAKNNYQGQTVHAKRHSHRITRSSNNSHPSRGVFIATRTNYMPCPSFSPSTTNTTRKNQERQ